VTSCVGYGWTLQKRVQLAVPLVFQFIAGWAFIGQMNAVSTLLVDIFPKAGASSTAINNFVRCLLGAVIVSFINPIINAIDVGWAYVLLSGICLLFTPLFTVIIIRKGSKFRAARLKRQQAAEQRQ